MDNQNYKIILDESVVQDFIYFVLPDLRDNETFYVCLFARSKYLTDEQKGLISHIKSDKAQLKRFTSTKDRLISKIRQLECKVGSYKQYGVNKPTVDIPQESLAIYITPNPRNTFKAIQGTTKKFIDIICNGGNHIIDPSTFAMSEIQRSKSRTVYTDFDFDDCEYDESFRDRILKAIGTTFYHVLKTRGGFHLLIEPVLIPVTHQSVWYQNLLKFPELDMKDKVKLVSNDWSEFEKIETDIMLPIPGTYQGGFMPEFIK